MPLYFELLAFKLLKFTQAKIPSSSPSPSRGEGREGGIFLFVLIFEFWKLFSHLRRLSQKSLPPSLFQKEESLFD
jgi:hypothetical protein